MLDEGVKAHIEEKRTEAVTNNNGMSTSLRLWYIIQTTTSPFYGTWQSILINYNSR